MHIRTLGSAILVSCLAAASLPARADVISGSFAGTATSGVYPLTQFGSFQQVDLTGSAVSGTFSMNSLAYTTATYVQPGISYTALAPGAMTLTFYLAKVNQTYVSYNADPLLLLEDDGVTQTLVMEPGNVVGADTAFLSGPEGSLFSNIADVSTLRIGSGVVLGQLSTAFNQREIPATNINVTSQTFTSVVNVPEPSSWMLLATCVAAMAAMLGTKRRQPSHRLVLLGREHD